MQNRDRLIGGRMTAKGGGGRVLRDSVIMEKGLMDMDNSVMIVAGRVYKGTKW